MCERERLRKCVCDIEGGVCEREIEEVCVCVFACVYDSEGRGVSE